MAATTDLSGSTITNNPTAQLGLLVGNAQLPVGDLNRAQCAGAITDVNGNVILQVGTDGAIYDKTGASVIVATTKPTSKALTDGATITWALDATQAFQYASVTLGGNRTLAFTGLKAGMRGDLLITQDGTGSRTLTLPANSKSAGTPSTTAAYLDKFSFYTPDGTNIYWTVTPHLA